jgi:tyrosinase
VHAPNALNDWTVRIHFKKYELGGSFAVLIFLGEVPGDASQWRTSRSLVGSHHAFVNSAASQCDNCRDQADLVVEGFVHLNSAIAAKSGLSSYEPDVVIPYLKDNLHWRIQAVRAFLFCFVVDILDTVSDVYFRLTGLRLT